MRFRSEKESKKPLAMFTQSSLTDIVLLLLIFFLLTSSFVTNLGIKVTVPRAESGAPATGQQITVAVTKDGKYYVDGELTAQSSLAMAVRNSKNKSAKTSVVLRADKDAKVDDAVRVMNIAKALDLTLLMATERTDSN